MGQIRQFLVGLPLANLLAIIGNKQLKDQAYNFGDESKSLIKPQHEESKLLSRVFWLTRRHPNSKPWIVAETDLPLHQDIETMEALCNKIESSFPRLLIKRDWTWDQFELWLVDDSFSSAVEKTTDAAYYCLILASQQIGFILLFVAHWLLDNRPIITNGYLDDSLLCFTMCAYAYFMFMPMWKYAAYMAMALGMAWSVLVELFLIVVVNYFVLWPEIIPKIILPLFMPMDSADGQSKPWWQYVINALLAVALHICAFAFLLGILFYRMKRTKEIRFGLHGDGLATKERDAALTDVEQD